MVSGKPPRHSRPKNDPVTIDLEARDETPTSAAATPAEESVTEPLAVAADAGEPNASVVPEGMAEVPSTEGVVETTEPSPSAVEPEQTFGSDPQAEPESLAEPTPSREPEARAEPAPTPRPAPAPQSPAFASLAAVGILGGLIALAGAGALQYGGILPGIGPATPPAVDTAVSSDIASLKAEVARLSTAAPAATDGSLEKRIADLEAAQGATQQPGESQAAIDALKAALAQSTQDIAALKAELAATRQSQTDSASALETRLSQAETRLDEPRQDVSMAHAIAVSALKTAIDRGGPFLGELNTLAGISPEDAAVAALQPHASVGILSRAELVRRVPAVADAILAAINQPAPGEGWSDRLLSSALSVVKVRPVGNVEGETPEAIVARMEDKLRNGDLKGAELEWQTLPDPGKAASVDFHTALQTRIDVETIVSTALTDAVGGKG